MSVPVKVYVVYRIVDNTGKNPLGYRLRDENNLVLDVPYQDVMAVKKAGKIELIDSGKPCVIKQCNLPSIKETQKQYKSINKQKELNNIQPIKVDVASVDNLMIPSLYGVHIKNIKKLHGREGEAIEATVYYNGKRLGRWGQDPNGCVCDDFEFNSHILDEVLAKYSATKPDYSSIECMMSDVYVLWDKYNIYKKILKSNMTTLVCISDFYDIYMTSFGCKSKTLLEVQNKYEKEIQECLLKYGEGSKLEVFFSCNDFCIQ